jgi:GNAT superfamily N-acetyltransferase
LLTSREFDARRIEGRRELLRAETGRDPSPGLIAYVDGTPAGWVRVGPRTGQPRLSRTRNYAGSPEPFADPDVWAVSCFVVRREYRRQGLNAALLTAAVAFAREGGARVVEAYPIDTEAKKTSANDLYHGVLSTFAAAGFHEVSRPKPHIAIVQFPVR